MIPVLTQGVKALVSYTNTVVRSSIVTLEINGHSSVLWGCTEKPGPDDRKRQVAPLQSGRSILTVDPGVPGLPHPTRMQSTPGETTVIPGVDSVPQNNL